ncbi:MAG TPA: outer membrane protein assembly factor BamE [Steroidobacteraceae bacterium]|nr:outer membrane protein assembly factor BamE [Steroidobacteraceae bacterium]
MKIITESVDPVESSPRASAPPQAARSRPALPHSRRRSAAGRRAALLALLPLGAMLGACVYRMPIRQGNYLDPAAIAQVKPGMTHSQVRYLLGTPMVPGTFDASRWDYDYYLNLHRLTNPPREHVTIYFSNDVVSRVVSGVSQAPVTYIVRHGVRYPTPY